MIGCTALRQQAFENLTTYRQGTCYPVAEKKGRYHRRLLREPKKAYDLGFGHLGNGLTV
ncbi:MAG: hypothetical protein ACLTLQ_10815 [[Clostridium] scindens]